MRFHRSMKTIPCFALILAALSAPLLITLYARGAQRAATRSKYLVYVGTYTEKASKGIYACRFDPATDQLTSLGLAAETADPSFLAADPTRRFLYAVNEISQYEGRSSGGVSAFAIAPGTGKLTFLNEVPSGGAGPCHLTVDKTGKYVLVANYGGGSLAVFPILKDGRLGKASAFVQHSGASVNPQRQEGPHVHSVYMSPDNRFAISADLGLDEVLHLPFRCGERDAHAKHSPLRHSQLRRRATALCLSSEREICICNRRIAIHHHRVFIRPGQRSFGRAPACLNPPSGFQG